MTKHVKTDSIHHLYLRNTSDNRKLPDQEVKAEKGWSYTLPDTLDPLGKKVCVSAHIEPKEAERFI